MKVVDFLKKSRWIKGSLARSASGRTVLPTSRRAVSFCLLGAMRHCYPDAYEYDAKLARLKEVVGAEGVLVFNDDDKTTFRDVRRVLKEADV